MNKTNARKYLDKAKSILKEDSMHFSTIKKQLDKLDILAEGEFGIKTTDKIISNTPSTQDCTT